MTKTDTSLSHNWAFLSESLEWTFTATAVDGFFFFFASSENVLLEKTYPSWRAITTVEDGQGIGVYIIDHGHNRTAPHLNVVCLNGGKHYVS